MKIDKLALYGYLTLCVVAILANYFDSYGIKLISKSLLIPVLFFYYIGNVEKLDILACLYLLFNFCGDSVGVFELENEVNYLIVPFFCSNIVLILIQLKKLKELKFSFYSLIPIVIIILFLIFLWFEVVEIFTFSQNNLQLKIGIYGISLIVAAFLAAYVVVNKVNTPNLYLLFCVTCLLISDLFYILYNFQVKLVVLDSIHFSCQIFSYLFFVKFMISKEELNSIKL